jgi:hypothetical protein
MGDRMLIFMIRCLKTLRPTASITRYESDMEIVYLKSTVFELNEVKYIVMSKSNRLLNGLDKLNHTQSTRNK